MSSTLAEQLAPLASKPRPNPNAWRTLMKPKELAAFDAGKYNRRATTPRDSARISRDNRLGVFDDENEASAKGTPTPEENALAAEFANSFDVVGTISKPCVICGQMQLYHDAKVVISKYPRVAIGTRRCFSDDGGKAFVLCQGCFDALGLHLTPDRFFDGLPALDQKVWTLMKDGLTGVEIAARLSVNGQRITQQQVSDAKLRVQRRIQENKQSIKYGQRIQ